MYIADCFESILGNGTTQGLKAVTSRPSEDGCCTVERMISSSWRQCFDNYLI